MTYRIRWIGDPRPNLEDAIRADIAETIGADNTVDSLVFHTFFVTEDVNGQIVWVCGTNREDEVTAEFHDTASWAPIERVLDDE